MNAKLFAQDSYSNNSSSRTWNIISKRNCHIYTYIDTRVSFQFRKREQLKNRFIANSRKKNQTFFILIIIIYLKKFSILYRNRNRKEKKLIIIYKSKLKPKIINWNLNDFFCYVILRTNKLIRMKYTNNNKTLTKQNSNIKKNLSISYFKQKKFQIITIIIIF